MLLALLFAACALAHPNEAPATQPDSQLKMGGGLYRTCYFCHSLEPGVHLTGPSLANTWGQSAGQVAGFALYTDALKSSKLVWNESTLKKWIKEPHALVPGTSMTFDGWRDEASLDAIVAFLKIAMAKDGAARVVEKKLVSQDTSKGERPRDLSHPADDVRVVSITHCRDTYEVITADKKTTRYWDQNLDFKVMTGLGAPPEGQAVRRPTGSMGDRFKIVFRSFAELSKLVQECKKAD